MVAVPSRSPSRSNFIQFLGSAGVIYILFFSERPSTWAPAEKKAERKASVPPSFPPACTDIQRGLSKQVRPMRDTSCPDATWLLDDETIKPKRLSPNDQPILFEPSNGRSPLAIYIGCNKGIDAVDTLRFLSQDPVYDKNRWLEALDLGPLSKGVCGAESSPQVKLDPNRHTPRPATLHCVEAMPATFEKVKNAAQKLNWEESFVVHHAAASDSDGIIPFPDIKQKPGYESLGIEDCETTPHICQNVTLMTLDRFFREKVESRTGNTQDHSTIVDFLSIDVEGFDWPVLSGGKATLQRTKYVEFEVHNKGVWKDVPLATAIKSLREQNFCCYYAGKEGKLWRLTDCMDGVNIFSNVACVNLEIAPHLAKHMEDIFLKTISVSSSN